MRACAAALLPLAAGRFRQLTLASLGNGSEVAMHRVVHRHVVRLAEDTAEGPLSRRVPELVRRHAGVPCLLCTVDEHLPDASVGESSPPPRAEPYPVRVG